MKRFAHGAMSMGAGEQQDLATHPSRGGTCAGLHSHAQVRQGRWSTCHFHLLLGHPSCSPLQSKRMCSHLLVTAAMETHHVTPKVLKPAKKVWAKSRSQAWWEECADPSFPADEFQHLFRVSRETFCIICDKVGTLLTRQNTRIRAPVPVQQRVASGEHLQKPASVQTSGLLVHQATLPPWLYACNW